ncbi:hypothetical protein [Wenzhouxiangella sediminis]|uniref:Uncharacterized protein n=1 Tax=Wenzhouxiangella sediminis TaxID=1792836 RepID=A0A3E1KB20_9GAMM|nr:hypothetical protein [Wenzhouxiangella sediminis]RFF31672.1 hypothetical protein DZC52_03805 [Wenzhouxiangella sediminis]
MDGFLRRQKVDVSRSFAVLLFVASAWSLMNSLSNFVMPGFALDASFIVSLPLALGLWHYRPWARIGLIALVWLGNLVFAAALLFALAGDVRLSVTIRYEVIADPTPAQIAFVFFMLTILAGFLTMVVHSGKFREEVRAGAHSDAEWSGLETRS